MTIRIASIQALRTDDRYWYQCGLDGIGSTGTRARVFTGPDGKGLYFADAGPVVQLLDARHFEIHRRLSRGDALHRIVAALMAVGWGPDVEHRDSISNNPLIAAKALHEFTAAADPGWSTARTVEGESKARRAPVAGPSPDGRDVPRLLADLGHQVVHEGQDA